LGVVGVDGESWFGDRSLAQRPGGQTEAHQDRAGRQGRCALPMRIARVGRRGREILVNHTQVLEQPRRISEMALQLELGLQEYFIFHGREDTMFSTQ
jgi:hypothetical protein